MFSWQRDSACDTRGARLMHRQLWPVGSLPPGPLPYGVELRRSLRRTRLPRWNDEGRARSSIAHRRKEVRNPRGRAFGMGTGWAGPAASPAHLGRGSRPEYVAERPPICRRLQLLDLGGGLWTEQIAAPRGRSASHQRGAINLASSSLKEERFTLATGEKGQKPNVI